MTSTVRGRLVPQIGAERPFASPTHRGDQRHPFGEPLPSFTVTSYDRWSLIGTRFERHALDSGAGRRAYRGPGAGAGIGGTPRHLLSLGPPSAAEAADRPEEYLVHLTPDTAHVDAAVLDEAAADVSVERELQQTQRHSARLISGHGGVTANVIAHAAGDHR